MNEDAKLRIGIPFWKAMAIQRFDGGLVVNARRRAQGKRSENYRWQERPNDL
jgi:hypothetical protein